MGAPGDDPPVWRVGLTYLGPVLLAAIVVGILWKVL